MELRYLATFQTIAREGSFTKAAEKLDYAPSTITLHIQQLEAELGFKLFIRQGKHIQLSTAGQALYEQADTLLRQVRTLEQTLKEIAAGESGSLRIGVIEPASTMHLMPLLAQFCQQYPKIHISLEITSTRFICQRVAKGKLEIGICSPPPAELGLVFEPLFFEPIALLMPADHPLVTLEEITPAHLQDQRLLLTGEYCAYRETIEYFLSQRGIHVFPCLEISSLEALKQGVQSALGLALIPINAVNPPPAGTVLRPLAGIEITLPVGLVYSPEHYVARPVLEKLIQNVRSRLSDTPTASL